MERTCTAWVVARYEFVQLCRSLLTVYPCAYCVLWACIGPSPKSMNALSITKVGYWTVTLAVLVAWF